MATASGKQAVTLNSRRAAYGYEPTDRGLRIGRHGHLGQSRATAVQQYSSASFGAPDRLFTIYVDRYGESYRKEIETFLVGVAAGTSPPVSAIDGLRTAYLAEAAGASLRLGRAVELKSNCEVIWNA